MMKPVILDANRERGSSGSPSSFEERLRISSPRTIQKSPKKKAGKTLMSKTETLKVSPTSKASHKSPKQEPKGNKHFLVPLTKAENITISLIQNDLGHAPVTVTPGKRKFRKTKNGLLQIVSNGQSFLCSVDAVITQDEVSIKVYLTTSLTDTSTPMFSIFADLNSSYNVHATVEDVKLQIQQQHAVSGNTTNVLFLGKDPGDASSWADFINSPHIGFTSPGAPLFSTSFNPAQNSLNSATNAAAASPNASGSGTPLAPSEVATPPKHSFTAKQMQSPRRRSHSLDFNKKSNSGASSAAAAAVAAAAARAVAASITADDGANSISSTTASPTAAAAGTRSHAVSMDAGSPIYLGEESVVTFSPVKVEALILSDNPTIARLQQEIQKIRDDVDKTERHYKSDERAIRAQEEQSLLASVQIVVDSLKTQSLTASELASEQEKIQVWERVQRRKIEAKSVQRNEIIAEEIKLIRAEGEDLISKLMDEIRREEERVAAAQEAAQKQAAAEQQQQQQLRLLKERQQSDVMTGNNRKRLVSEDASSVNDGSVSPRGRASFDSVSSAGGAGGAGRVTRQMDAENKARVQREMDAIRAEMAEREKNISDATAQKNAEEELKLKETLEAVYMSLQSQGLPASELLEEQEKVHIWENVQRAKLAKSIKARRKQMNKQVTQILLEGRERIKNLMIECKKYSMLVVDDDIEVLNVEDENVKYRTYSDVNTLSSLSRIDITAPTVAYESADDGAAGVGVSSKLLVETSLEMSQNEKQLQLRAIEEAAFQLKLQKEQAIRDLELERDIQVNQLKQEITNIQMQMTAQERSMVEEESLLCMEETTMLSQSVGTVYGSLLHQGLSPEELLTEQEKVENWGNIQRKKQQKKAAKRKAALRTAIAEMRAVGEDKIAQLEKEIERLFDLAEERISETTVMIMGKEDDAVREAMMESAFNIKSIVQDLSDDSPLQNRIKAYSMQQFEIHASHHKELNSKQNAIQQEILAKKYALRMEEEQRLEALRLEKEAAERKEQERLAQIEREKEEARLAEEARLKAEAEELERIRQEEEAARKAEEERMWQWRRKDFAERIRIKMIVRLQRFFRCYLQHLAEIRLLVKIQAQARIFLAKKRVQRKIRGLIQEIENQSARVIVRTLRAYVVYRKLKFNGWSLINELTIQSVLNFCLQRREIRIVENKLAAFKRKKKALHERRSEKLLRKSASSEPDD